MEFYEQQCLLLPAVRYYQPHTSPEDLTPPESLRRLQRRHADGLHPFDAELGHNPLLVVPDCSKFEPWEPDDRVTVTTPDERTVRRPVVARYYAPWQVHVVALLRQRKHYDVHSRFLRHIDPSHDLWKWHRIPEDTEQIRSLRGMANGFDALERFRYADQVALKEAFDGVPTGELLPEAAQAQLRSVLTRWAQQALTMSGLDEPAFFVFLGKLARLIDDNRRGERVALAEDVEEYLLDAQALAREVFTYDWKGFLAAAEEHAGAGVAAKLRRLDPVEAAAQAARTNLKWTLEQDHLAVIVSCRGGHDGVPADIAQFCLDYDLLEVLYSLQRFSYTDADQRIDRFPGFLNRRLRPLALAGEPLARCIVDILANCELDASDATPVGHHGQVYSKLIEILGARSSWLPRFKELVSRGAPSDKQRNLDQRALSLTEAARAPGTGQDEGIACTLAAAVATRNLVSHRDRFLPLRAVSTLGGPCAGAVPLIWFLARDRGLVLGCHLKGVQGLDQMWG